MEEIMYPKKNVICPHVKEDMEGATCSVADSFIRDMEDVDINLCRNRHYEACVIYLLSLREMALKAV